MNPQFNRPLITGGADTRILLPESNAKKFKANLGKWTQALSSWTAHTVQSARERIETIAAKFNTTPEALREANRIPPKMRLKAGSTILVPKTAESMNKDISVEVLETAKLAIEPDVPDRRRVAVKAGKKETLAGTHRKVASAAHGKKTVVTARAKTGSKTTVAAKAPSRSVKKAPPRITLASER